MKKWKWALALICLIEATSAFASREGTGVGNGGGGRRDEYLNKLRREMGPRMVVGAKTEAGSVSEWCSRVSSILKREMSRATNAIQRNNFDLAEQILIDALVTAAESMEVDPDLGGPMTKTLIDRGLLISEALDQTLCSTATPCNCTCEYTPLQKATKLNFLVEYVRLLVRVERDLDRPWYIPYRYQYASCRTSCRGDLAHGCWERCAPDFRFSDFQRTYIKYAREQLDFVTRNFTDLVMRDGRLVAVPVGDARAFLKIAEFETAFVGEDLSNNIHAYRNACAISDLASLHMILEDYNLHGDRTTWPNDRYAVAATRESLDEINAALGSCYRY